MMVLFLYLFVMAIAILFALAALISIVYGIYSLKIERFDKMMRLFTFGFGAISLALSVALFIWAKGLWV